MHSADFGQRAACQQERMFPGGQKASTSGPIVISRGLALHRSSTGPPLARTHYFYHTPNPNQAHTASRANLNSCVKACSRLLDDMHTLNTVTMDQHETFAAPIGLSAMGRLGHSRLHGD
ncbi:hypothetical protein RRG08_004138 [Elysia crispata]|uniref:Uncharacterized protein n=1 Tax=Elysia crispata TaxID=231223 RepID=A0AAE0YWG2_9GAST|nr:hypothetical protein RRG08_004138 [Elysia crispata]